MKLTKKKQVKVLNKMLNRSISRDLKYAIYDYLDELNSLKDWQMDDMASMEKDQTKYAWSYITKLSQQDNLKH